MKLLRWCRRTVQGIGSVVHWRLVLGGAIVGAVIPYLNRAVAVVVGLAWLLSAFGIAQASAARKYKKD